MLKTIIAAMAALILATAVAQASPIDLTFTGTIGAYGMYDGSQQFGPNSYGNTAAPLTYSITLVFDPSALSSDTCPANSVNTSCQWNFGAGGISEVVTINDITKTYTASSGLIQFCACTNDAIYFQANGTGVEFGGDFVGTNQLFSSQTNVNNPNLLEPFTDVVLSNASFQTSNQVGGSLSFSTIPFELSDSLGSTPASPTAVPEPLTWSLLGAGLAGLVVIRRRRKAAAC